MTDPRPRPVTAVCARLSHQVHRVRAGRRVDVVNVEAAPGCAWANRYNRLMAPAVDGDGRGYGHAGLRMASRYDCLLAPRWVGSCRVSDGGHRDCSDAGAGRAGCVAVGVGQFLSHLAGDLA